MNNKADQEGTSASSAAYLTCAATRRSTIHINMHEYQLALTGPISSARAQHSPQLKPCSHWRTPSIEPVRG